MNRRNFIASLVAAVAMAPVLFWKRQWPHGIKPPISTIPDPEEFRGALYFNEVVPVRYNYVNGQWRKEQPGTPEYETAAFGRVIGVLGNIRKPVMVRRCLPAMLLTPYCLA